MAEALAAERMSFPSGLIRGAAAAVAAILALVAAAWVVPPLLDWGRYRGAIATFAAAELGRPVAIDGPVSVVLLPAPLVIAGDVRLGDRGDGVALTAPVLRLRLALAPLLLGHFVPRDLVLSHAAIRLPWPLPPALFTGAPGLAATTRIEHSRLSLGAVVLTDLDASLAADSLDHGGVQLTGAFHTLGQSLRLDGRLGAPDPDGQTPVTLALQTAPAPTTTLHFAGSLAPDGALTGRLNARAADLSSLVPAPAIEATADGTLNWGSFPPQGQFALQLGGVPVTARLGAAARGKALQLSLVSGSLDLDAWRAGLARLRRARRPIGPSALAVPLSVDLTAAALRLRGGLIHDVHAAFALGDGKAVITGATAVLPGEAALTLTGAATGAQGLSLAGDWTLNAPQLRATLAWLASCGLHLGDLPPGVLRQADLAGHVLADRDRIQLDNLRGQLEQSQLGGRIGIEIGSGAVDAALTLDRLDADGWLPAGAPIRWQTLSDGLAGFALALKLRADQVLFRGETLRGVTLDAATDAGGLALNGADFDLDGLHGHLSGTIGGDGQVTGGLLDLAAPHGTALTRYLPPWARFSGFLWDGPIRLHAEANGPPTGLITALGVDMFDARLEAHPLIDLDTGAWSSELTLRHPGAPRLLAAVGLAGADAWLGEGSLSLLAQLSGTPAELRMDSFDLTAAGLHATGALRLHWPAPTQPPTDAPVLTGQVAADTLPLPRFALHSHAPMPLAWLSGLQASLALSAGQITVGDAEWLRDAHADVTLKAGVLKLDNVKATASGGGLTGSATLDSTQAPPRYAAQARFQRVAIDGQMFGTPVDLAAGRMDAALTLAAQGYSPASLLATLSGQVQVQAAAGSLTGFDLAAAHQANDDATVARALNGGSTRFDQLNLTAAIKDGTLTLQQAGFSGADGTAALTGSIDLPAASMDVQASLPDQRDLRLTGLIDAPRRVVGAVGL